MCGKNKKYIIILSILFLFGAFVVFETKALFLIEQKNNLSSFRKMQFSPDIIRELAQKEGYGSNAFFKILTGAMLDQNFNLSNKKLIHKNYNYITWLGKSTYKEYYNRYQTILNDIKYFPVLEDTVGQETCFFDNSWMMTRNYGGKRFHEGTDIMTSNNIRGYFKVISMTDGMVEQIGWLEKGGYRIGIRSESGGYFYYAHLYKFADGLEKGDIVKAGEVIGLMGDSGYSKIEGTIGKFDVHLHLGIYFDEKGKETSVNPYYILKYLDSIQKDSK